MRKIVLAALVIAAPAIGQTSNSTTTCTRFGQSVNCDTTTRTTPGFNFNTPQPRQESFWEAFQRGQQQAEQQRALQAQRQALEAQARASEQVRIAEGNRSYVRQRVGQLIASGDCQNGIDMAVANGEFELASQARDYCAKH